MIVFPNCKINLGLHILRKRADGFHDLATLFYPVMLQDALELIHQPSPAQDVELSMSGIPVEGNLSDNIVVKAWNLLKKDFDLPAVKMHLHKVIPTGAGLGGGSADGAFALMALNKKFNLGLTEEQLTGYALQLGSDCPFFILNKPCYATGRGEKMEPVDLDLSSYKILLVNPRIHVNTGWAFSQIRPLDKRKSLKESIVLPIENWKGELTNDFEAAVFEANPEVKSIRDKLYSQGALFASMSGSGSTVYGIFPKDREPELDFPSGYFVHFS